MNKQVSTPLFRIALLTFAALFSLIGVAARAASATVAIGKSVTLSVNASGTSPFTYQWKKDGTNLSGATASTYKITSAQGVNSGNYTVVVSNPAGSTTSDIGTLIVNDLTFTTQPLSQPVFAGATVTLVSAVIGTPAPTYQWQKNGVNISGANGLTLTISNVQLADAGSYALVATNSGGSVTSRFARLVVLLAQPNAITYGTTVSSTGVTAGGIVNLDYYMTNTGTRAWGTKHYLSIRDSNGTFVAFASLIGILPGENKSANLNFSAPTIPGTYTYYVQALENGVEFFSTQTTVTLTVLAPQPNSITYETTNFPVQAAPGSAIIFNYNVTNTGTKTWGVNHYLTLKNSSGTTLSSAPLTVLASGSSKTVNLSLTAPTIPGSYTYIIQAIENGVGVFNTQANLTLVVLAPQPNAIVYNPTRFPDAVVPDATVNLQYSLSNAGTQSWGTNHYVTLRDPNGTYLTFIPLTGVAPGGNSTAAFSFTAPSTPGVYTYFVQAMEDGIEFFSTQDILILTVIATPKANAITYNTTTFPSAVTRGTTVNFTCNVTNRGTKTWGTNHYLSLRDVDDTFLGIPALNSTAPGVSRTLNFSFIAPSTPGIYTYTIEGYESGMEFFNMADTLVLTVQ